MTVHLVEFFDVYASTPVPRVWCRGEHERVVTEALFATCKACLEARTRAASQVKPAVQPEAPKVNPWG